MTFSKSLGDKRCTAGGDGCLSSPLQRGKGGGAPESWKMCVLGVGVVLLVTGVYMRNSGLVSRHRNLPSLTAGPASASVSPLRSYPQAGKRLWGSHVGTLLHWGDLAKSQSSPQSESIRVQRKMPNPIFQPSPSSEGLSFPQLASAPQLAPASSPPGLQCCPCYGAA